MGEVRFQAGRGWIETGVKRVAPDFAPLRCATPVHSRSGEEAGETGGDLSALRPINMDSELRKHYALLLGVGSPWDVKSVELNIEDKTVEIELGWQWGTAAKCPECGREYSIHDSAPERTWRHLDTMRFETLIRARTPRANCPEHGVKKNPLLRAR